MLCYYLNGKEIQKGEDMRFPGGSVVKNPPSMQESRVQPLGWEDPLKKEMTTHSNILA